MKKSVPITIDDLEATALDDSDGHAVYGRNSLEVFAYNLGGPNDINYRYLEAGRIISRVEAIKILERN